MNDLQKCELGILLELDKLCRSVGLRYFLAYGTALGAVRHSGFIPWDDDVDIMMFREDYERLLKNSDWFIERGLFLQTVETDIEYPYPFAKIRKKGTAFVELGEERLNINHGVFIDVFPIDEIPASGISAFFQRVNADILWGLLAKNRNPKGLKKLITKIISIGSGNKEKYLLKYKTIEKRMICKDKKKSGMVANYTFGGRGHYADAVFDKKIFEPTDILFEGNNLSIMKGYKTYLTKSYGDYMELPPLESRVPIHNYCFYSLTEEYHSK